MTAGLDGPCGGPAAGRKTLCANRDMTRGFGRRPVDDISDCDCNECRA